MDRLRPNRALIANADTIGLLGGILGEEEKPEV